jgi:hypothetical protein
MYAGVAADFFCSGVSPSHDWREKTKETHPIILFRVNIAAIGIVLDIAPNVEYQPDRPFAAQGSQVQKSNDFVPDISASFLSFGGSM